MILFDVLTGDETKEWDSNHSSKFLTINGYFKLRILEVALVHYHIEYSKESFLIS